MIRQETRLTGTCNSGVKEILCIRVLGSKSFANIGDIIVGSVKKHNPKSDIKKKDIVRAVVVRSKKGIRRADGSYIKFDDNAVVIINKNNEPIGTRIGVVAREVRAISSKIVSLAKEIC